MVTMMRGALGPIRNQKTGKAKNSRAAEDCGCRCRMARPHNNG